jgi:CzcA family heavy metal efflux pump
LSGPLAAVVRFAVRFRGVVLALAVVVMGYGGFALSRARTDVFPEFAPPQVQVQTEAPGLAPEQVEALVTRPIESAVGGVSGVRSLRSSSIQGLSVVTVVFEGGTDVYRDRQVIAERLAVAAAQLPAGVGAPTLTPLTSSTAVVLMAGLTSRTRSLMDLRTIADWTVRRRLLAVPGVADVQVFGKGVRELQIQVHPERLIRFGLGIDDVLSAARRATGVRGAGFLENENQRIVVRTEGQAPTPAALARTVVARHGAGRVTLGNLADVVAAPAPAIGAAAIDTWPGIELLVTGQYGANTLEVTRRVETALADLRPALQAEGVTLHPDLFRPADFVLVATRNVRSALLLGGALVVAVLFLFLFDLRTAAISCLAIPLSLLTAVLVLGALGMSLNTMTLGGLAIAIGEVVDDAVIDVENIVRRLRENGRHAVPRPAGRVVFEASLEVRGAVVYATLAVILVFVPILTLGGVAGRLFAPLAVAYVAAVVASLGVALTLTPALSMLLLARRPLSVHEPLLLRGAKARYGALLRRVERRPGPLLAAVGVASLAAVAVLPFFGASFLPELQEGHYIVHMIARPGTSLDESLRIGRRVTRALLALPFVRSVVQQVGRAEQAEDVYGPQVSEIHVDLKRRSEQAGEAEEATLRRVVSEFPGADFAVNTFLTERMEETLSGYRAPVAVKVFGSDLDALDREADEVAGALRSMPGATGVERVAPPGGPELVVALRDPDLVRWGFDRLDVLDAVRTALAGEEVGQVYAGDRSFDVAVLVDPGSRSRVGDVAALPIRNAEGTYVRVGQLADVREGPGRYEILHDGGRRAETVTCGVSAPDVGAFVRDAARRVRAAVKLAPGSYLEFAGAAEAQARARSDLLVHSLVALAAVVLLLSVVTRHGRNLALVLTNLPFALIGGVLAAFALGGVLSLGAMIGFVTLFGITLRNSILMVSHFEHLVAIEGRPWGVATALEGAADRFAPIVMTSLVTALGLLPLAVGLHAPGREIEGPMAIVILGGLATSMLLNLLVLPTLSLRFGRFEQTAGSGESGGV